MLHTDSNHRIQQIRNGCEHDILVVGVQGSCHVCRQPLHNYVVRPVHAEVSDVDRPQRPVTDELNPSWIAVGNLYTQKQARLVKTITWKKRNEIQEHGQ